MAAGTPLLLDGRGKGIAARAAWLALMLLFLFTALLAGHLWWEQDGSFESVISRMVPWQSSFSSLASSLSSDPRGPRDSFLALQLAKLSKGNNTSSENEDVNASTFNQDLIFEPAGSWARNTSENGEVRFAYHSGSESEPMAGGPIDFSREAAHKLLGGKWVYFWGDSTMRQVFTAFLNGIQGSELSFEESKSKFRSSSPQEGRKQYTPLPHDDTPCWINEHVEHEDLLLPHSGQAVNLTYGWKHFLFEEYDVTFLQTQLPNLRAGRLPDVIVISSGLHNCYHFKDAREWEDRRDLDAFLAELDRVSYALPPIVWLDNVIFDKPAPETGYPEACRRFNEYLRARIRARVLSGNRRDSLVSREQITWTSPSELWGDQLRLHLAAEVYTVVAGFVLQAMEALRI